MTCGATPAQGIAGVVLAAALAGCMAVAAQPAAAQGGYDREFGSGEPYGGGGSVRRGWYDTGNDPWVREPSERDWRPSRRDDGPGPTYGRRGYDGDRWNDAQQTEVMERLELAADRLREALVLLRQQPSSRWRDLALQEARQALVQTQNALTWAPRGSGGGRSPGDRPDTLSSRDGRG